MNNNIGVAVLDTGIYKHIDFGNRIIAFKDFINNRAFPYDDSGHGTHVSGIIAGDGYASHGRFKGIAPMSQIISVKVLDSNGNGNIENVIKGTKWIINNKDIYNIKIVNISFGTTHNPSSGTSMSAPIVSGAIARVLNNHDYTPDEIRQRLKKCCHKVNLATNQQGWGHLDIIQFIKGP